MKKTIGTLSLYESDIKDCTSDFVKETIVTNIKSKGVINHTFIVEKTKIDELSLLFESGRLEFFVKITCGGISTRTLEFVLDNTAVEIEKVKPIQNNKSNPFGNNIYILHTNLRNHNIKRITQTAQDILDNAKINVQVYYLDMTKTDNKILASIILRKYLASTDAIVFLGHGADINLYLLGLITSANQTGDFFSATTGGIPGGVTLIADKVCVDNPKSILAKQFYYSAYEVEIYDTEQDSKHKTTNISAQDMFLGRGVIHEWVHQSLFNQIGREGNGHSKIHLMERTISVRYETLLPDYLKKDNMMNSGDSWGVYQNPKITDDLFTFLDIDLHWIKQALGSLSIAKETKQMVKISKNKANKTTKK